MQFYEITRSVKPEEIGITYPQSQTARQPIPTSDPRYLGKQFMGVLKDIPLPEPVLHPDAKLSDLISTTATWRLVLSPKLKKILEKFIEPEQCQFLKMMVHYVSEQHQYWMLNPLKYNMDVINFKESQIWLCGAGDIKIKKMDIDSLNAFTEHAQALHLPDRINIYDVKLVADPKIDFILLRDTPGVRYFVSEKLKTEIISAECTGISFTRQD